MKIQKRNIVSVLLRIVISTVGLIITLVASLIALPVYVVEYLITAHKKLKTEEL